MRITRIVAAAVVLAYIGFALSYDTLAAVFGRHDDPEIVTYLVTQTPTPAPPFTATPTLTATPEPTVTPTVTPTAGPTLSPPPTAGVAAQAIQAPQVETITLEELDDFAAAAGWDLASPDWESFRRIVQCEDPTLNIYAHNSTDPAGGSFGLAQLNGSHWFDRYGEDFGLRYDPVVNLRTARKLHEEFGRFGGTGLWSCADRLGIY